MYMTITYGIDFPFRESKKGFFLNLNEEPEKEIRSNLVHLILTRKGSRYYLPDFGTRLYEFIFEPNDTITFNLIEDEIRTSVKKYIPNLEIKKLTITSPEDKVDSKSVSEQEGEHLFTVSDGSFKPYTAQVKLEYEINNEAFSSSDFIIINI